MGKSQNHGIVGVNVMEVKYNGDEDLIPEAIMGMISLAGDRLTPVGSMDHLMDGAVTLVEDATVYRREGIDHHPLIALVHIEVDGYEKPTVWRALLVDEEGNGYTLHGCVVAEAIAGFFGDTEQELLDTLGLKKHSIQA